MKYLDHLRELRNRILFGFLFLLEIEELIYHKFFIFFLQCFKYLFRGTLDILTKPLFSLLKIRLLVILKNDFYFFSKFLAKGIKSNGFIIMKNFFICIFFGFCTNVYHSTNFILEHFPSFI